MLKKIIYTFFCFFTLGVAQLPAEIEEITQIEQILSSIEKDDTLILFNISEVVIDSQIDLGTSAWRKYIRKRAPQAHDALTLFVARNVPQKPVEDVTPQIIKNLQDKGYPVMAFTSRGRSEWYSTKVPGVDQLTEDLLKEIHVDFSRSQLPPAFKNLDKSLFAPYYRNGILYANHMEKGDFLKEILQSTGYRPSKIIFVDDKRDSLETVETALKELGIPFAGFWYTRTALDHHNFSLMIAHVQLAKLIFEARLLSNDEASLIVIESYAWADPYQFFYDILDKINLDDLNVTSTTH